MAGTIPTAVDYGVKLLNPSVFFGATAAICTIVGVSFLAENQAGAAPGMSSSTST